MRLHEKGDKFELKDISEPDLWVLYWSLCNFYSVNGNENAKTMAAEIYEKKLRVLDVGYQDKVNPEIIRKRNAAILNKLKGLVPVEPGGY